MPAHLARGNANPCSVAVSSVKVSPDLEGMGSIETCAADTTTRRLVAGAIAECFRTSEEARVIAGHVRANVR